MTQALFRSKNHPITDDEIIASLRQKVEDCLNRIEALEGRSARLAHTVEDKWSGDPVALARIEGVRVYPQGTDTDVLRALTKEFGIDHLRSAIMHCRQGGHTVYVNAIAEWMRANKPHDNGTARAINYEATRDHLCIHPHDGLPMAIKSRYAAAKAKPTDRAAIDRLMAEYPQFRDRIMYR